MRQNQPVCRKLDLLDIHLKSDIDKDVMEKQHKFFLADKHSISHT